MHASIAPSAVVIGGGQAGLSISYFLTRHGIDHVVFERERIAHAWRSQRWDSFCLVTPNWQCRLPGFPYPGEDPQGFMRKDEIAAYVEEFARRIAAPVREGVGVTSVRPSESGFAVETSEGLLVADAVFVATGGYHTPRIPRLADRLAPEIVQVHSSTYRRPDALPPGAVLVVGSGQSGCQIAEDLHLAGRRVHLSVGSAPRSPRSYRGRDAIDWLEAMGHYDIPVQEHPRGPDIRRRANHYMSGRDGGHEIDLRRFAVEGMRLHGRLLDVAAGRLTFADDLAENLDGADATCERIKSAIDAFIEEEGLAAQPEPRYEPPWRAGARYRLAACSLDLDGEEVRSVIWCTGFERDYRYIDAPAFDERGDPVHERGVSPVRGLYFVGLPWLHTWGSGRFAGVARDAEHVVSAWRKAQQELEPAP